MTEPRRILEEGSSDLGDTLVRSALEDRPGERARRRTMAALGVGAALTAGLMATEAAAGTTATKAAAGPATLLFMSKWAAIGMASGALALGGVRAMESREPAASTAPPALSVIAPGQVRPATPLSVVTPESLPIAEESASAPPAVRPDPILRRPSSSTASAEPSAAAAGSSRAVRLALELALVDEARQALARRDWRATIGALDRHDGEFPRGALATESTVLRIEALVQGGHRAAARSLAEPFLASNANSPVARRVKRALGLQADEESNR